MREFEIKPELKKKLIKLFKKDKKTYEKIMKKIKEVIDSNDVEHYKNLRYDMKDFKRVHIGHFILVFSYDKSKDVVSFEDFSHHDEIYR
ncbi:MAG: type II toxin-antitoxin system RelE/ParE family toxin [Nanoarchaeota archaeon]|nr:type II toxin-antitoxin system RelE/ParE family toxin [Nanoarchaeota archaeon]